MAISRAIFNILFEKYIQPHMQTLKKTGTFRNSEQVQINAFLNLG